MYKLPTDWAHQVLLQVWIHCSTTALEKRWQFV